MMRIFILVFPVLFMLSCKGSGGGSRGSEKVDKVIKELYPPHKSQVSPDGISAYVILGVQPDQQKINFMLLRNGERVVGDIKIEKTENGFLVEFVPIAQAEGTYTAFFGYGDETVLWTFFAETTKAIPLFQGFSIPKNGERNFPIQGTMALSFEVFINPETIDEQTVKLIREEVGGKEEVRYNIAFIPNTIVISSEDMSSSTNYKISVSGLATLPSQEPFPTIFEREIDFRSIDMEKPSVNGCSPDFCIRDCSNVDELKNIEILFNENEDIDPSSFEDIYIEVEGRRLIFREIYYVKDKVELIAKNTSGSGKIYIFPNKILIEIEPPVENGKVRVYILPGLSDSSGNMLKEFFAWCINVL